MPKTRTMGAGLAGSTARNVSVNSNTGGGNKKQGLSTTTNKRVQFVSNAIKTRSYGENRNVIFCVNQLGGVGAVSGGNGSRMFGTTSDGVKDCITGPYGCEQVVREAYLEAYGREPDKSGLRTYCIAMTKRRWSKADIVADLEKNEDSLAPIYASLAGNYLMEVRDFDGNVILPENANDDGKRPVNIDSLGNITVNPTIGKITVNSETEYSLTMDEYGVTDALGGKWKYQPGQWDGVFPKIVSCELFFIQDDTELYAAFYKDSDKDGIDDFNDHFPLDPSETADADGDGVGDNADAFPNDPTETADADDDGIGDNADAIITTITESALADDDGAIQIADLYASGIIVSGTNVDELFNENFVDTDEDGSISPTELTEGLSAATVSVILNLIEKFGNDNGKIENSPEFDESVMKELGISGARFITNFDTNGDNSLSTEELMGAARQLIIERIGQGIAVMNMASVLTASGLAGENGISLNTLYAAGLVRQDSRADQLLRVIVDSDTDGVVSATEMTIGLSSAFAVAAGELITQFGDDSGVIDPESDNFGDFDTAVQEELNMTGTAFIAAYGGSDGVLDQGEIMSIALALLSEQLQGKLSTLSSWQTYKQVFESKRKEINDDTSTTQEEKDELIAAAKLELFENIGCYDPTTSLDDMTKDQLEQLWLCQRMKEWDLTGDGKISFEEYKERMNRQNYEWNHYIYDEITGETIVVPMTEEEIEENHIESYNAYQNIEVPVNEFTVEDWLQLELRDMDWAGTTGEGRHITREELLSALKSESTSSNIEFIPQDIEVVLENTDNDNEYNYVFKISGPPDTLLNFGAQDGEGFSANPYVRDTVLNFSLEVINESDGTTADTIDMNTHARVVGDQEYPISFIFSTSASDGNPITLLQFKNGDFDSENILDINFFDIDISHITGRDNDVFNGRYFFILSNIQSSTSPQVDITFQYGSDGVGDNADADNDGDGGGFEQYEGSTVQETAQNIMDVWGTSGVMTQVQLTAFINSVNSEEITEQEGADYFNSIDDDDNNVIDVNELAVAFGGEEKKETPDDDADESGKNEKTNDGAATSSEEGQPSSSGTKKGNSTNAPGGNK